MNELLKIVLLSGCIVSVIFSVLVVGAVVLGSDMEKAQQEAEDER